MATYFVSSSGSNTAPYDTWAKAATSFQTALTAATASGDIVVVQHNAVPSGDAELAVDTTYTIAGNIAIFAGTNDGGSSWTQTTMGTANWIGNSTTNRSITMSGAFAVYIYGLTLRVGGATADNLRLSGSSNGARFYENCYLWSNANSASNIQLGGSTTNQSYCHLRGCTLRFGSTGQTIAVTAAAAVLEECVISSDGSAITQLLSFVATEGVQIGFYGCDLSAVATGCTLVPDATQASAAVEFVRCKLPTSYAALATQSDGMAGGRVFLRDCAVGDTHGTFEYHDAYGSVVTDTSNKLTAGAAGMSWKITTTSICSQVWPFRTPYIDLYHDGVSTITPYLELLRNNGTASAYTDQEVWAQFSVKNTSGSVLAELKSDRASTYTASGTAQAAGIGTGSWTIASSNSPNSFKCDSGSSFTPQETGHIRARVCVAVPSISGTLYVDPQIRF